MATRIFLLMNEILGLLALAILKIIKTAEEGDAAHEFITNLSDMNTKLVKETPNYPVHGNNVLLFLEH
ncbi:hypothetical protein V1477_005704 [Vespula maculifrons]|uniref:Uncharacterized protein n=1 Tax=Vespula maculifrons TaxID=7453 RepID=A0ABD2CLR9_VESMC